MWCVILRSRLRPPRWTCEAASPDDSWACCFLVWLIAGVVVNNANAVAAMNRARVMDYSHGCVWRQPPCYDRRSYQPCAAPLDDSLEYEGADPEGRVQRSVTAASRMHTSRKLRNYLHLDRFGRALRVADRSRTALSMRPPRRVQTQKGDFLCHALRPHMFDCD